jgi:hypothetical protein
MRGTPINEQLFYFAEHFKALSVARLLGPNGAMREVKKKSGCNLIKVLTQHFPGRTEENGKVRIP